MTIRTLFDPSKDISRNIEKVITYGVDEERRLKAEISEYVVTEKIEEQFESLLSKMQLAMDAGGENEIGVWVSGFYGSGKSSLTKYLGLALDNQRTIDGIPFLKYLQDRLNRPQTRALLSTVAQRFPAAVVMLDLASDMLAGATMENVSTVLYYKVLLWAGYSRNLKVAAFERMVEKDGRQAELEHRAADAFPGATWKNIQNNPLTMDALIPQIAHDMYPSLFPTASSFSTDTQGIIQFENQRVEEMIEIVRTKSGKKNIVFIVDEVGQYVASRDNLILNLDGLAKNLKRIGGGKVWVMATAQQTLTEDDPRAALNSEKLYKLKDRFPIRIDLESSDIKEICYRRLLAKSPAGRTTLEQLFDAQGQALRYNTRLQDAKYYDANFTKDDFVNLYPFLPAHFDILLHLLGALAKSTGGIGLRSAIKIIQDVLRGEAGSAAMADQSVGWLATTVTIYDELAKDISRGFPSVSNAVGKVAIRFPNLKLHQDVAKTVAVLQILGNLPVMVQNVASLMHPSVTAGSTVDEVRKAVEEMIADAHVPLGEGEKAGTIVFLSEKLRDIEQERGALLPRSVDVRRIFNDALRDTFHPLPRVTLEGNFAVTSGVKVHFGGSAVSLSGDQNPIQTIIELVQAVDYDAARARMLDESRSSLGKKVIGLVAKSTLDLVDLAGEIHRSLRIVELHRNDADQEVREYCNGQTERANRLSSELQSKAKQVLQGGSFVFRGQHAAVSTYDPDLSEATKKILSGAASQVFDRYGEAPHRVPTDTAEKCLKAASPSAINASLDPLGLVQSAGGKTSFRTDHKAIVSLRDYVGKRDHVEGKRLLDDFQSDPFGWSPDTTRYILTIMLMAGELKLKVSGREVTTNGPQALEALKTNNSFKAVGVALRTNRPDNNTLVRAAERLAELVGEHVLPLEPEITKAATKHIPQFQNAYGTLPERLKTLGLVGSDRLTAMAQELTDIMSTDGSDAPQRFGAEISKVYDDLRWAQSVKKALENGLDATIMSLQTHRQEAGILPTTGVPGELRKALEEDLNGLAARLSQSDFHTYSTDFNTLLTQVHSQVADAVTSLLLHQRERIKTGMDELARLPEWNVVTAEEQTNTLARLTGLNIESSQDLVGFRNLLARDFDISSTLDEVRHSIQTLARDRRKPIPLPPSMGPVPQPVSTIFARSITVPMRIISIDVLDALINHLNQIRAEAAAHPDVDLSFVADERHG